MVPITVVIPIGPSEQASDYFDQAMRSLIGQTQLPAALVLVDDMSFTREWRFDAVPFPIYDIVNKWRLGVAGSFNVGVAAARTECVLMMGADDTLEPTCIEECSLAYEQSEAKSNTYFWMGVRYSDGREDQYLPCHAAMVTKSLWELSGGLPIEAASGASDAAIISIMLSHPEQFNFHCVNKSKPLYNYRVHAYSDTASRGPWQSVILETRNLVSELWTQPTWGRYS